MREKQRVKILDYMKEHGSINPLQALKEIGCMRLAPRIWELRNWDGYNIRKETEFYKNSKGEQKHYAKYVLENNLKELTCTCDTDKPIDVSKLG